MPGQLERTDLYIGAGFKNPDPLNLSDAVFLDGRVLRVDVHGNAGETGPIFQIRRLDGSNAATNVFAVNKDGTFSGLQPILINPMTTTQDIIVGGAAGAPARLGVGANGSFLNVSAGLIRWGNTIDTGGLTITAGGLGIGTAAPGTGSATLTVATGSNPQFTILKGASTDQSILAFQMGAGLNQFHIRQDNLAALSVYRYNSAGIFQDTPLTIAQSNGQVTLADGLTVTTGGVTINGSNPHMSFAGVADARILSGSNTWAVNDNSNSFSNLLLTNAGAATIRSTLTVQGASITVGTNPAVSGAIALPNNAFINSRNAANTLDLNLVGTDVNNRTLVGSTSGVGVRILNTLDFTTDNTYDIGASGANRPRNLYVAGIASIGAGTFPSAPVSPGISFSSGGVRFFGRNNANNADVSLLNYNVTVTDGMALFGGGSSAVQTTSTAGVQFPNVGTTASAANAFLDNAASNNLLRSTSSLRYKKVIGSLSLSDARRIVNGLRPIVYRSKARNDDGRRSFVGLGAEHVAKVDSRFVTRDARGRPDWVQYQALVAPIALVLQDIDKRLEAIGA